MLGYSLATFIPLFLGNVQSFPQAEGQELHNLVQECTNNLFSQGKVLPWAAAPEGYISRVIDAEYYVEAGQFFPPFPSQFRVKYWDKGTDVYHEGEFEDKRRFWTNKSRDKNKSFWKMSFTGDCQKGDGSHMIFTMKFTHNKDMNPHGSFNKVTGTEIEVIDLKAVASATKEVLEDAAPVTEWAVESDTALTTPFIQFSDKAEFLSMAMVYISAAGHVHQADLEVFVPEGYRPPE